MRSLLISISFILSLFGLELGLQLRSLSPLVLPLADQTQCPYVPHSDPLLSYLPRHLAEDATVRRDPRWLLVGDSIAAGDGFLDLSQALGPRLSRALAQPLVNLAVPGYNLEQQLALLNRQLDRQGTEGVKGILLSLNAGDADGSFSLSADCRLVDASSTAAQGFSLPSLLRLEESRRLVLAKGVLMLNRTGLGHLLGNRLLRGLSNRAETTRWSKAKQRLGQLRRRAADAAIPLGIIIFPYAPELTVPAQANPLAAFLNRLTKEVEVPAYEILPQIRSMGTDAAFLDGNALHLSGPAYEQLLPDLLRFSRALKAPATSDP